MISIGIVYNLAFAILTILAFFLSLIAVLAYHRSRDRKLAIVSAAFILFFIKGLLLSYSLFTIPKESWSLFWIPVAILDCVILLLFYISVIKG